MRSIRRNICLYAFAAVVGCTYATGANAQMRAASACSNIAAALNVPRGMSAPVNICYTNYSCAVGMRGDWMDFTDEVTVEPLRGSSGLVAGGYVVSKGVVNGTYVDYRSPQEFYCIPVANKTREGFVGISIRVQSGNGRMRVTALRPGTLGVGRHSDYFDVEVRDGSRYLEMYPRPELTGRVGQTKTIEIAGRDLRTLRLKSQPVALAYTTASAARAPRMAATAAAMRAQMALQRPAAQLGELRTLAKAGSSEAVPALVPEVTLIGATPLMVRLQIKFDRQGIFSLEDYLEFADGEPDINRDLGWPLIDVKP